jgi:acyl-CoA thioesterase
MQTTPSAFARLLGVAFEDVAPDRSRLRLAIRPELLNSGGNLHGGVLASLIDAAIAAAVRNGRGGVTNRMATVDLNVTYVRAIRRGTIVVEGWVLRRGRGVTNGEAEVFNDRGELLAKGRASLAVAGED